jgi:hypothetical protein
MACTEPQCLYKGAHLTHQHSANMRSGTEFSSSHGQTAPSVKRSIQQIPLWLHLPTVTLWNSILEDPQGHIQVWPCEPGWTAHPASLNRGGARCSVGTGLYEWVFRKPSQPATQHVSCTHLCLRRKGSNVFRSLTSIGCSCGHDAGGARSLPSSCVRDTRSQRSHLCNRGA